MRSTQGFGSGPFHALIKNTLLLSWLNQVMGCAVLNTRTVNKAYKIIILITMTIYIYETIPPFLP